METNKQKLSDLIAKLKEKGLMVQTTNSRPISINDMKERINTLLAKIKANETK